MRKMNEADARTLNAGKVITGQAAKDAAGMPGGYRFYAYCPNDGRRINTYNVVLYATFVTAHQFK